MINQNAKKLEVIKKSLQSIGYSLEEAEKQIEHVGKVVTMAILHKLLAKYDEDRKLTPQDLEKFLRANFNATYLQVVIEEESDKIVKEYLKEVIFVLPKDKKATFSSQVSNL